MFHILFIVLDYRLPLVKECYYILTIQFNVFFDTHTQCTENAVQPANVLKWSKRLLRNWNAMATALLKSAAMFVLLDGVDLNHGDVNELWAHEFFTLLQLRWNTIQEIESIQKLQVRVTILGFNQLQETCCRFFWVLFGCMIFSVSKRFHELFLAAFKTRCPLFWPLSGQTTEEQG